MVVFYLVNSISYFAWMDGKWHQLYIYLTRKISAAVVNSYIATVLVYIPFIITKMLMGIRFIS